MQVVLVMFRNDGERRSFSVVRNMTMIGRREDCDLRIPVGDVSRKHCRLVRTDDGIRIEDLGSSNGTFVNGDRVQESELHPGDVVGVGPVQFIVQIDGVPAEEEMTAPAPAGSSAADLDDDEDDLTTSHAAPQHEEHFEEEPLALDDSSPAGSEVPSMELDELPTEEPVAGAEEPADHLEEFAIDEEPLSEVAADDLSPDKLPSGELPPDELSPDELSLDELSIEEAESDAGPTEEPAVEHAVVEPDGFALEDELSSDAVTIDETPAEAASSLAAPVGTHEELEEFLLEDEPDAESAAGVAPSVHSPVEDSPGDSLGELEFEDEAVELSPAPPPPPLPPSLAMPVQESADSLEELEFEDEVSETEEASVPEGEIPLSLAPANPAYADVNMDGEEELEELELDDEHAEGAATPPAESDSAWDFVIEETDPDRSHHDLKLDLDSPHGKP